MRVGVASRLVREEQETPLAPYRSGGLSDARRAGLCRRTSGVVRGGTERVLMARVVVFRFGSCSGRKRQETMAPHRVWMAFSWTCPVDSGCFSASTTNRPSKEPLPTGLLPGELGWIRGGHSLAQKPEEPSAQGVFVGCIDHHRFKDYLIPGRLPNSEASTGFIQSQRFFPRKKADVDAVYEGLTWMQVVKQQRPGSPKNDCFRDVI